MNEVVHVTFTVMVADHQFSYISNKNGHAELQIQVPRFVLDGIERLDPGSFFRAALAAALIEYDKPKDAEQPSQDE